MLLSGFTGATYLSEANNQDAEMMGVPGPLVHLYRKPLKIHITRSQRVYAGSKCPILAKGLYKSGCFEKLYPLFDRFNFTILCIIEVESFKLPCTSSLMLLEYCFVLSVDYYTLKEGRHTQGDNLVFKSNTRSPKSKQHTISIPQPAVKKTK